MSFFSSRTENSHVLRLALVRCQDFNHAALTDLFV